MRKFSIEHVLGTIGHSVFIPSLAEDPGKVKIEVICKFVHLFL